MLYHIKCENWKANTRDILFEISHRNIYKYEEIVEKGYIWYVNAYVKNNYIWEIIYIYMKICIYDGIIHYKLWVRIIIKYSIACKKCANDWNFYIGFSKNI